jgi:chromosome segregation ATPase
MSGQVWIGSELPEITALKARIAELEGERDNAVRYTELLIQDRDNAKSKELEVLRLRIAELEGERDAAKAEAEKYRAGESRAVDALRKITLDVQDYPAWQRPCFAVEQARQVLADYEDKNAQPALDWLAQDRREAAAEELEGLRDHIQEYIGPDDARDEIRRICANRIADLRAGKGVQDAE